MCRYPPVTQTVLLTRHPLPWNSRLFISLSGHRLWLTLLTRILTQLRERGLGRVGKWKLERWWLARGSEDTLYGGAPASAGIHLEHSVLEKEPEGPFSMGVHCRTKIRILWGVAVSPFALQTCALGLLPRETHSALDGKGPLLILLCTAVRGRNNFCPAHVLGPYEDNIPAQRPTETSDISHETKRRKTFPTQGPAMRSPNNTDGWNVWEYVTFSVWVWKFASVTI